MRSIMVRSLLLISGLIAAGVGAATLFAPHQFHAMSGISLEDSASLMSEIRAPGGLLLVSGLLIALGAFVSRMMFSGLALSALVFLSYGLSRLWSMIADGMPANVLIQAAGLELFIGIACVIAALVNGNGISNRK